MPDVFGFLAFGLVALFLIVAVVLAGGYRLFRWVLGQDAHQLAEQINKNIDNALAMAMAANPFLLCFDAECRVCDLRREKNR